MAAALNCPHCANTLRVAAAPLAGTQVRCYLCKEVFTAGTAAAIPAAPRPAAVRPAAPAIPASPYQTLPHSAAYDPLGFGNAALPASYPTLHSNTRDETPPWVLWLTIGVGSFAGLVLIAVLGMSAAKAFVPPRQIAAAGAGIAPAGVAVAPVIPAAVAPPVIPAPPPVTPTPPPAVVAAPVAPFVPPPAVLPPFPSPPLPPPPPPPSSIAPNRAIADIVNSIPQSSLAPLSAPIPAQAVVAEPTITAPTETYVADQTYRYRWEVGRKYDYHFKVLATNADGSQMESSGLVSYEVNKGETATADRVSRSKPGSTYVLDFNGMADERSLGLTLKHLDGQILLSAQGEVLKEHGESMIAGSLDSNAALAIDRLPKKGETTWKVEKKSAIDMVVETFDYNPNNRLLPRSGFDVGRRQVTSAPLVLRIDYQLGEQQGDLLTIHKKTFAAAVPPGSDKPMVASSGEGIVRFDVVQRVMVDCKMNYLYVSNINGVEVKRPMTFKYELARERAVVQAEQAEAANKLEQNNVAVVREVLAALKGTTLKGPPLSLLIGRIHGMKPIDGLRRQVAEALDPLLLINDYEVQYRAVLILEEWGTEYNVPTLCKLLDSNSSSLPVVALRALALYGRSPEVATLIVGKLGKPSGPSDSYIEQALKKMGSSVAEYPLVAFLESHDDQESQLLALRILKELGTRESLPALKKLEKETQFTEVRNKALMTTSEIYARVAKGK